jgi:hypothetical protein
MTVEEEKLWKLSRKTVRGMCKIHSEAGGDPDHCFQKSNTG